MARRLGARRGRGDRTWPQRGCVEALARSIADKAARADIEAFCDRQGELYVAPREVGAGADEGDATKDILVALTYLEMRGLLVHDPVRPEMVRLL
jgi:hypothetical protein